MLHSHRSVSANPKAVITLLGLLLAAPTCRHLHAQTASDSAAPRWWNAHFQQTVIGQYQPGFSAKYSGRNSFDTAADARTSLTTTLYLGCRLWEGAEAYFNPELAGGSGLSGALGIAGFPNGETFRIGDPKPEMYIARAYIRQTFPLTDQRAEIPDDRNQLAGRRPRAYLAVTAGKFSIADFFDDNSYSHDPRTQFMNWSLMSNGAWDYPANTRGYTYGIALEYVRPDWALRVSAAMVPEVANGPALDPKIAKANSETVEFEKQYAVGNRPGMVRALAFFTRADMGNYAEATVRGDVDITATRAEGRSKYGFGISARQEIADGIGAFARAGWNDGKNETWAFTEIDRSVSGGVDFGGKLWGRTDDNAAAALVVNNISEDHRRYLQAGGYGFIIGDGNLSYAPEIIAEAYYSFRLGDTFLRLTPDYQFVLHPAYNSDRGPVHLLALRAHIEL